jgi:hypothetical protein
VTLELLLADYFHIGSILPKSLFPATDVLAARDEFFSQFGESLLYLEGSLEFDPVINNGT